MSKKISITTEEFSEKIEAIKDALTNSNDWVDDRLNVRRRDHGLLLFLKVIVLPFAKIFGWDPFNHTRIHHVAISLMIVYQDLESSLDYPTKESVSLILDKLEKKSTSKTTKKYLGVFTSHLTTPLAKLPSPLRQPVNSMEGTPAQQTETTPLETPITLDQERVAAKKTEKLPSKKREELPAKKNTYLDFLDLHHRIMQTVDQVLSQEVEIMNEMEKDSFYYRILEFKRNLRDLENESLYASIGRLQVIMLRNQLKLAFDELTGYREDYYENTRKFFEKSAKNFFEKYVLSESEDS